MKHLIHYCLIFTLALSCPATAGDVFSPKEKHALMASTLQHLWGNVLDYKGIPIQPANEHVRTTFPISQEEGFLVIDEGIQSGLASSCQVPWQDHYLLYMQHLRQRYRIELQLAYASMLHGVAQSMIEDTMKKSGCPEETKKKMQDFITQDSNKLHELLRGKKK